MTAFSELSISSAIYQVISYLIAKRITVNYSFKSRTNIFGKKGYELALYPGKGPSVAKDVEAPCKVCEELFKKFDHW